MKFVTICMVYLIGSTAAFAAAGKLVIVILSQSNKYHEGLAEELKGDIEAQSLLTEIPVVVYLSHADFPYVGAWAVTPLIPHLTERHRENCLWFVFIEDRTQIRLDKLNKTLLEKHDCSKDVWLGYALHDIEPTIIHHFAFYDNPAEFKYPNTASGFAITNVLMRKLATRLQTENIPSDFTIDHAFELALFIWNDSRGPTLTEESGFCITEDKDCCTFAKSFQPCGPLLSKDSIYFAVKTCEKFHEKRLPVVQGTWGSQAKHIYFFSDTKDDTIPTISLGIPNTERGHCAKTFKMLKHVAKHIEKLPDIKWITIADDDTILSVARLQELLTCYDDKTPVALGERYGYNIHKEQGYNYITGGGGIVLSRNLLEKLVKTQVCECPSSSSPDDMFLGICLARMGIEITHSPLFHQGRPMDYAPEYLENQHVVSFHKHWMIDPVSVYIKWFTESSRHIEL